MAESGGGFDRPHNAITIHACSPVEQPGGLVLICPNRELAGAFDPDQAYPAIYARSLAEEAGLETRYRAYHTLETTPWQNRSLSTWNQLLATDDEMRAELESAEVVIMEIGVHTIILECGTHLTFTKECLIDVTATMPAEYERLFRTVEELVDDGTM